MLLEARGLEVRYGRNRAVKGIDIFVADGEIVTVLGANGAGKTSLLRALQGVTQAGGTVRFDGHDISAASSAERVRRGLVLVPEGRQIFVVMTVHENLLIGAHLRRDAGVSSDIDAIYDRFPNLAARRNNQALVLSGGEQQMLAIGRALLAKPRLMMLDEPSLGLSPLLVDRLFGLIGELNRDGLALLIVEQNTVLALDIAARGYVLELGAIAMQGDAATLAADPALAAAYLGAHSA
jgi:branched-chain amino acid transport system ATP-binding protein